jgi:putative DNA primase/helicase
MSADMAAAGEHIVRRLGGVWSNGRGMCQCPAHEDRTPSLSVRCGRSALLFKCFAGCTITEILAALRREKLVVPEGERRKAERFPPAADMRRYAARLWREGRPVSGTPAERYLRNRAVPAIHDLMRYHPATPLGQGRPVRRLPALLVAVGQPRRMTAVQRIFLQPNGRPALLSRTKRALGPLYRDAVQLFEPMETLGLAEGVENALSASLLLSIPVWASLGAERFDRIEIPSRIKRLVLLADNDRAGRRAVTKALRSYALPEREIIVLWPAVPFNDWNDMLRAGGKVRLGWERNAA